MNRQMNQKSGVARSLSAQGFTEKQGQYLAFIYTYAHMFGRPPAETDMQRHFQVSPPSVHQMIVTLERNGLIRRHPAGLVAFRHDTGDWNNDRSGRIIAR